MDTRSRNNISLKFITNKLYVNDLYHAVSAWMTSMSRRQISIEKWVALTNTMHQYISLLYMVMIVLISATYFFLYKRLVKWHICCCSSVRIGPLWRVTLVQRRSGFRLFFCQIFHCRLALFPRKNNNLNSDSNYNMITSQRWWRWPWQGTPYYNYNVSGLLPLAASVCSPGAISSPTQTFRWAVTNDCDSAASATGDEDDAATAWHLSVPIFNLHLLLCTAGAVSRFVSAHSCGSDPWSAHLYCSTPPKFLYRISTVFFFRQNAGRAESWGRHGPAETP